MKHFLFVKRVPFWTISDIKGVDLTFRLFQETSDQPRSSTSTKMIFGRFVFSENTYVKTFLLCYNFLYLCGLKHQL